MLGLPEETVSEKHGDLIVLQGTTVEVVVELDQEVSEAELRIDRADAEEVQGDPAVAGDRLVSSQIPQPRAAVSGKQKCRSTRRASTRYIWFRRETGFENIYSPKYEIRPQPDLIPRAGFVDQQETTLLLPPNDILALKAMAEDDLPLVSLEQGISVNGREWEMLPLETESVGESEGRQVGAAWQWDLLKHQLKAGDQLLTKLVATDRLGNTGESIPLRIVVAAQDFDPQRHAVMERKASLYDDLADFAELLDEHKTSALEVIERLRQADRDEAQTALDRTTLQDLASRQRKQAAELLDKIKAVEREMPPGADAYDLELTGRVIARIQQEHASSPAYLLSAMQHARDPGRLTSDLNELKRTFERTADDAKNVAGHYQWLMTHNFLSALAGDFDALLKQQRLVVDSPTQTWERLLRQETIVINQLRVLERLIRDQQNADVGFHRSGYVEPVALGGRPANPARRFHGIGRQAEAIATDVQGLPGPARAETTDRFAGRRPAVATDWHPQGFRKPVGKSVRAAGPDGSSDSAGESTDGSGERITRLQ